MRTVHAVSALSRGRHAIIAAGMLGVSLAADAAPLNVVNPGFEDISGEFTSNEFTFGAPNGWDLYDPGSITNGGSGPVFYVGTLTPFETDPVGAPGVYTYITAGAPEGARVGIAFNFAGSGGSGEYGFEQTLTDTLASNTRYRLEVDVINIASGTGQSGELFNLEGFPGYRIELLAGGQTIAADLNSLAGSIAEGGFAVSVVEFTTGNAPLPPGQNLAIRLVNLNLVDPLAPGADLEVDFDNVRLSAVSVPLPPMLPAIALGCLALCSRRRGGARRA